MSSIILCVSDENTVKSKRRFFNNIRWLLTHRNKTIKQKMLLSPFSFFLEQFQLHFRVRKKKILPKTGLYVAAGMCLVGAYVIHLGHN